MALVKICKMGIYCNYIINKRLIFGLKIFISVTFFELLKSGFKKYNFFPHKGGEAGTIN